MAKKKPNQKRNMKNSNPQKKKKKVPQKTKKGLPENWEDQVKTLTAAAMSIIHNEKNAIEAKQIPEAYQKAQQEVQHQEDAGPRAVADVSLWVLEQVENGANSRNKVIKPIVVLGAIGDICGQVAEVATVAGVVELSEEDAQISVSTAINKYVAQAKKEGRITDQQLREAGQALQKEYPEEAKNFQKMLAKRQQRQQQEPQGRPQGPQQAQQGQQQPQPQRPQQGRPQPGQQAQPTGLLRG